MDPVSRRLGALMAVTQQIGEQAYQEIAMRDSDVTWELHEGRLRQ